jgi:hypothetical protein
VTFVTPDGEKTTLQVNAGDSLLDIAHEHDIDLEGIYSLHNVRNCVLIRAHRGV